MKKCYFLIGLPGVGKSTITNQILNEEKKAVYLSTDQYLENIATRDSITYNESWGKYNSQAQSHFSQLLMKAMKNGDNLVWDQTNLVKSSRIKKIKNLLQNKYIVIGLNFEIPDEELNKRLYKRESEGGKKISRGIISHMKKTYERASYDEGFHEIFIINENSELNLIPNNLKLDIKR